jgi:hypothetical protein
VGASPFSDKTYRLATELVAFRVLDPALRSRSGIVQSVIDLAEDPRFATDIEALLVGEPAGRPMATPPGAGPGQNSAE